MRRLLDHFLDLCKNRIFVMLCGIIVLFAIIVVRLFSLQVIHGADYEESITASVSKKLPVRLRNLMFCVRMRLYQLKIIIAVRLLTAKVQFRLNRADILLWNRL